VTPTQIFVENLLQALSAGIMLGCIYGLMCTGLGLIFGIMRVINFAQGDFMMLGMYAAFFAFPALVASLGPAAPFVAAVLAGPAIFLLGYMTHLLIVRQVSGMRVSGLDQDAHNSQLVLTLGLALILQNGGLILFGSDPVSIRTPLSSRAWELGFMLDGGMISVFFNKVRLIAALICIGVVAALYAFVEYTRLGRSLRAAADNPLAAMYMGVDVDRAHRVAFAIGCGIAAIAGGLIATYHPFQPYVGFEYVIVMYAGVVLGGIGSIIGAFWGGFVIGVVQQLSSIVLPLQLQNAAIFVVFLLVIFVYPQGFFGRSAERT
jgi:branched-chain amino acid transport system permease protein